MIQPISDRARFVGPSEVEDVNLTFYFAANAAAGALTYSVSVDGPAAAEVLPGTATLRIPYAVVGSSVLVVTATGAGASASDTLTVMGLDNAPPGPGPGKADFLPIQPGTVWEHAYLYEGAPCWTPAVSESGTVTSTFVSETLSQGTRTVSGTVVSSIRTIRGPNPNTGAPADTTYEESTRPFVVTETAAGVNLSDLFDPILAFSQLFPRYHAAGGGPVLVDQTGFSSWTLNQGAPPSRSAQGGSCSYGWPAVSLAPL